MGDRYLPAPLTFADDEAAVTECILLGTGVLLTPLWYPLRLAEDAALLDLLSGGRLILGLGLGWRDEEYAGFGVDRRRRGRALEEMVATLRPRRYGSGGSASRPLDRVARIADGYFAAIVSLELLAAMVGRLGEARPGLPVGAHVPVYVWDGPEELWSVIRELQWYVRWKYMDMEAFAGQDGPAQVPAPLEPEQEARLRRGSVVGRPGQVAAELGRYRQVRGAEDHLVGTCLLSGPAMGYPPPPGEGLCELAPEVRG